MIGGGLLLILNKFKGALVLIKFLKFGKLLTTASTMGVMIWAYSYRYGWTFATGFVLLILVHELGHGWAAQKLGIRVGAPIFIPFLGAFIALKDKPRNHFEEFFISAGGPLAGVTAALICIFISEYFSHSSKSMLLALGYFTLVMNLFNLTPIGFLDGNGMVSSFRKIEWIIGYPLLVAAAYLGLQKTNDHFNPIVLLVLLFGGIRTVMSFFAVSPPLESEASSQIQVQSPRLISAITYFCLTGFVIYMIHDSWGTIPQIR